MTTKDTINEQTHKTEQVISQVTGMPAVEPVPKVESTTIEAGIEAGVENTPPPDQLNTQAIDHLKELINAIKVQVRQEVLAELLPLMEAMEKAAKGGGVVQQPAPPHTIPTQQPAPPPTSTSFQGYVAGCEARAQELQSMVERKVEERRQQIYQRIQQQKR